MSFESKNPATGELLGTYPEHSAHEVELRLQSAWEGWKKWSRTPLPERAAFLIRLAELLEKRVDEYARLITLEMGKPIGEAQGEVKKAAFGARHFAEQGAAYIQPEAIPGTPGRVVYESLGPILAIMPWNLLSGKYCVSSSLLLWRATAWWSSTRRACRAARWRWRSWFTMQEARQVSMSISRFRSARCRRLSRIPVYVR